MARDWSQASRTAGAMPKPSLPKTMQASRRKSAWAGARAGTTATLAVQEGVQMHGGMGMTDQFDIGFFMKRARVCQELFGDSNYHADQLARMKSY